jgi:hypothetical protein
MSSKRLSGWDITPDPVSPSDPVNVPPPISLGVPPMSEEAAEYDRQRERERRNAQLARERSVQQRAKNNPNVQRLRASKVQSPNGLRSKSLALNYHTDKRIDKDTGYVVSMSKTDKRKLRKKRQQERAVRVALALAEENKRLREYIDDMY